MKPLRVAVLADYLEEKWPSMDLVAEMFAKHLDKKRCRERTIQVDLIRPPMCLRLQNRLTRSCGARLIRMAWNGDRVINRFWDYSRELRKIKTSFDLFHVADHSYSQLIHDLPPGKTVVTCHDLDTFRPMWEPKKYGYVFKKMVKRIYSGLQKAAQVTCDSQATYAEFKTRKILPSEQVSVVYMGTRGDCSDEERGAARRKITEVLTIKPGDEEPQTSRMDLLHVGSTISRKRIEFLLELFAAFRTEMAGARLIRVGGPFTQAQEVLMHKLGIQDSVLILPFLTPAELEAVYRRAQLLLVTSDAEGFGLPVVEALACGTPVVASDLPVLREVGGTAAKYAAVADLQSWLAKIRETIKERGGSDWPQRQRAFVEQGQKFSWENTALRFVEIYARLID